MSEQQLGDSLPVTGTKKVNPQTWTRMKRIEIRELANDIGNEAVYRLEKWPSSGEGRQIKALTERISKRLADAPMARNLREAFEELEESIADLSQIRTNGFFLAEMSSKAIARRRSDKTSMDEHVARIEGEVHSFISSYEHPPEPKITPSRQLIEMVPQQQFGPVYFEIYKNKLKIRHTAAIIDDADKNNVESAAASIASRGEALLKSLASGNHDKRICHAVEELLERMAAKQDIIQLGIANIAAQHIFAAAEEEMSPIAFAELQAFGVALSMYVAQFPQWIRFSDNAASADYTQSDIKQVHQAGIDLAMNLEKAKEAVDPEVPRTLRWMSAAIENPRMAMKRAIFACIRTIENLLSVVMRTFADFLGSVKEGVNSGAQKGITAVVASGLLIAAANVGVKLWPSSFSAVGSGWVKAASKLILSSK